MARNITKNTDIEKDSITQETAQSLAEIQQLGSALVAAAQSEHEKAAAMINQRIGRRSAYAMVAKLLTVADLVDLQNIKNSKSYKNFTTLINGKMTTVSTWDEYCEHVEARSRQSIDNEILNLNALGPELFESMRTVGIGPSTMRAIRQLPEDKIAILDQVKDSKDKDEIAEIIEALIDRNSASKTAMEETITELEADHQTQGEILAEAKEETLRLKTELKKLKPGTKIWEASIGELKTEITNLQSFIDESIARQDESIDAIDAWLTAHVVNQPGYDPESPFVMPAQAMTVLVHLEDCINRSAHLIAAARHKLHNEFGTYLADARRHLLAETEE